MEIIQSKVSMLIIQYKSKYKTKVNEIKTKIKWKDLQSNPLKDCCLITLYWFSERWILRVKNIQRCYTSKDKGQNIFRIDAHIWEECLKKEKIVFSSKPSWETDGGHW